MTREEILLKSILGELEGDVWWYHRDIDDVYMLKINGDVYEYSESEIAEAYRQKNKIYETGII